MEDMGRVVFRMARGDEAHVLSDVALRSKAHWGYDADFLDACRAELTIRPEDMTSRQVVVAESESAAAVLGFYSIDGKPPEGELGNLWVVPPSIGTGLGRKLWEHAAETARAGGYTSLRIEADPNAVGFYRAMGAKRVGEAPSRSIAGRALPVLVYDLARSTSRSTD